ncbi:CDP-glycerol poly(glycerophosphate) glycerophosphotransferase [Lactiplantibacillus xiangfangensis]|uniref:CDP-glycerol poly(Glycerophosphate) glycerophosphotransferase n=1 Tax=Lactiplantibacillus xiangfangensis TaxID=942150 RepID=A0A0R2M8H5_9LACO|nr:CDP-glycerol glycerophosphotransferase family protein [Lactiplantibacillus xiangfangensis]KRO08748.1 CDP-glycerol poly(glycerophosphate) glycerophosphotransferase [Lactiplantibacillus xiangfangensis]
MVAFYLKVKKFVLRNILPLMFRWLPLKKRYLFSSFYGLYNDSPKLISERLHDEQPDLKIYWIYDNQKTRQVFPEYVQPVAINSVLSIYLLWTSKYLIDNSQKQIVYQLRKDQIYLQTWHGTPLKRIEFDASDKLPKHYLNYSVVDNASVTFLLIGNQYSEEIYRSAFGIDPNKYRQIGIPRNDSLLESNPQVNNSLNDLNITTDTFIITYAPTFRNKLNENGLRQLDLLNPKKIIAIMEKKTGKKCVLLTHFHPNVGKMIDQNEINQRFSRNVIDVTTRFEMQEILQVTDFLITDYSSVFFDYALKNKPIVLFMYDYANYVKERGMYLKLDKLPIKSVKSPDELSAFLKRATVDDLMLRTRALNQSLGSFEHGTATRDAVRLLIE